MFAQTVCMQILLSAILLLEPCLSLSNPVVTTRLGKIQGHYQQSFENRTFLAFEGIPFAKPPVGERRFEAPEPIEKWDGIWNATYLYTCAQVLPVDTLTLAGDEDCLYLNIYVPRTHIRTSENLDVIIHIHGGGYFFGSGHDYASPGYLMDHDVIFVTFNYRLGILGFLSTEDHVLPGNNGLKDQVLALKWVQSHIDKFGGNPNSVTLTGLSSGGVSVQFHYLSPMSLGLFQKGFSQSGTVLMTGAMQRGALDKAKLLGLALGCSHRTSEGLKKCFKQRTYWQILSQMPLFYGYKGFPNSPFGPVVETCSKPFLTEEPYKLLRRGQVQDLPWLASFVSYEGNIIVFEIKDDIDEVNRNWIKYAPLILSYNYTIPKNQWKSVGKKIKDFYLGENQDFTNDDYEILVKIAADRVMIGGFVKAVKMQAKVTSAPVYFYELSYTGRKNVVDHADDIQYFFYNSTGPPPTEDELKMKNILVKMLVNYAKSGKPTIDGVLWKPVTPEKFNVLNITSFKTEDIKMYTNKNIANEEFWDSIPFSNFRD